MWLLALPNVAVIVAALLITHDTRGASAPPPARRAGIVLLAALVVAGSVEAATAHGHAARAFGNAVTHWLAHVCFWTLVAAPAAAVVFPGLAGARRRRWPVAWQRTLVLVLGVVMVPASRFMAFVATALVWGDAR